MSMTKLIYGSDFDTLVGVGAEIVDRQGELTKQASTIFGMDYSDMKGFLRFLSDFTLQLVTACR